MKRPEKDSIETFIRYNFKYSTFVGLANYSYDFEKHKLVHCPWAVTYCLVLDLVLGIGLPIFLCLGLDTTEMEIFITRPITGQLNTALTVLNTLAIGVSIVSQWTNRRHAMGLFNDINCIRLHEIPNLKRSARIRRKIEKLIYIKVASMIVIVVGTFVSIYFQNKAPSFSYKIVAVYYTVMENLLKAIENQFYIALLYGMYLFKILNYHLSHVVENINFTCQSGPHNFSRHQARSLCHELVKIGRIHTKLHKLACGIKDLYQFQIIVILITVFMAQVSTLYYFVILLSRESLNIKGIEFLSATGNIIISVLDLWLLVYVCGDMVKACNWPGELIKSLNSYNISSCRLERCIETLSFQLKREKMHLKICGMFDLDWKTGFALTKASIMNLILLVQIDYKNF